MFELKHKLLCITFELESARSQAEIEMRENEESIKHLLQLLQITCQERDEAKAQLQRLLNACSLLTDHGICCSDSGNLGLVVGQKRPLVQEFNGSTLVDVVDVLVKGRSLPPKGRLLKAVIEAGPLLRTLMCTSSKCIGSSLQVDLKLMLNQPCATENDRFDSMSRETIASVTPRFCGPIRCQDEELVM
ncbi:hypothetical protein RJ639_006354 [Escallonia herrerae]|uniref:Uncharacterized protein n=1 Tax=Escallonia herrerae TaxID=1293975 RepID=A0AA89AUV2_9ASTE|nr:hypothetical protein RJ639_006354 [Escallonia herrerae]